MQAAQMIWYLGRELGRGGATAFTEPRRDSLYELPRLKAKGIRPGARRLPVCNPTKIPAGRDAYFAGDTAGTHTRVGRLVCPRHSSERNRQGACGDHAD
jgi:hypothetical protein